MKTLLISLIGILSYDWGISQARVALKFEDTNYAELPFMISLPLKSGEFCNHHFVMARPRAEDGLLELNVPLEKPGMLLFSTTRKGRKAKSFKIYLEPKTSVTAWIDANDEITFSGRLREENTFLNTLNREEFPHAIGSRNRLRQLLGSLSDTRQMVDTLEAYEQRELQRLGSAIEKAPKAFSEPFVNFIRNDIHFYHRVVGAAAMEFQFWEFVYKWDRDSTLTAQHVMGEKFVFWDYLFQAENFERHTPESFWYQYFLYDYVMLYKTFVMHEGVAPKATKKPLLVALENSNLLPSNEARELVLAHTFLMWFEGTANAAEMLEYYYTLLSDFPESEQMDVIKPKAIPIEKALKTTVVYEDPDIHLVQEPEKIRTIFDLISRFKGKVVLIDLWASWCGPCLFEFENNYDELRKLQTSSADFVILFVSSDRSEKPWKDTMYLRKLAGYHIRPNEQFFEHLRSELNWGGAIPRYAIASKEGKIVVPHAPGPGEGTELIQLLKAQLAN